MSNAVLKSNNTGTQVVPSSLLNLSASRGCFSTVATKPDWKSVIDHSGGNEAAVNEQSERRDWRMPDVCVHGLRVSTRG